MDDTAAAWCARGRAELARQRPEAAFAAFRRALAAALAGGGDALAVLGELAACLCAAPDRAVALVQAGFDLASPPTVALLAGALLRAGSPGLALQVLAAAAPLPRQVPALALLEARAWCHLAAQAAAAGLAAHPGAPELEALAARARAPRDGCGDLLREG